MRLIITLSLFVGVIYFVGYGLGLRDGEASKQQAFEMGVAAGQEQAYQQGYYDAMKNAPFWYQL